jgi:membrane-associated protease RseP (regulator of RpoE activity)
MSATFGIAALVVMLIVVILIHEAAHFVFAKRFGFKVEEFFVGFGPRLWSTRRGETEYGVKAVVAGGYVKIAGMNPFQPTPPEDLPRSYGAKPIWQRAIVIVAGPATHFVLAFVFLAIALGITGRPLDIATFDAVAPRLNGRSSPAAAAGLLAGDRVASVTAPDSETVVDPSVEEFGRFVQSHVGERISITVERDGAAVTRTVVPVRSVVGGQQQGRIGVIVGEATEPVGVVGAVSGALSQEGRLIVEAVSNMGKIFGPEGLRRMGELLLTDAPRAPTDPASVVGISQVAGEVARTGEVALLLQMFAFINLFIGLLNLLPLPPFDGGHLAVLAIEKVRGRRVDMRKLVPVSAVVLVFFVMFTMATVFLDLTKPLRLSP